MERIISQKGFGHNWLALNNDSYLQPFLFVLFQHDFLITVNLLLSVNSVTNGRAFKPNYFQILYIDSILL